MLAISHAQLDERPSRRAMQARAAVAILLIVLLPAAQAQAPRDGRSGREVVETVCTACHATGDGGAPKIGDRKAWANRASQGLSGLTQEAVKGVRRMPPHGGNPNLTDVEIRRAITFMVNQSGGQWKEPMDKSLPPRPRSGAEIVRAQCATCHQAGTGGAPRIGDKAAWTPRLKMGLDILVRSAINGHGGMPARGGMADLTDPELRSAIVYMFNPAPSPSPSS